ncbi:MAG: type II secretion system major pseudopilin GspG [Acidobacteriia bacterium]|nr:type II secretion system major pseudopilin GspG [Terriglobia bacterium]
MQRPRNRNGEAGITLLELLVVMVIIALFATLVGTRLWRNVATAKATTAKAQIETFENAIEQFRLDVGRLPTQEEGIQSLRVRPPSLDESKWKGPYLQKEIPMDPWGNAYAYRMPGQHGDYDILSYGRDGREGGDGEDADVVSWK